MEWQPIETAPKDGTLILAAHKRPAFQIQKMTVIYWDCGAPSLNVDGRWRTSTHDIIGDRFTHWMPLPEPPEAA